MWNTSTLHRHSLFPILLPLPKPRKNPVPKWAADFIGAGSYFQNIIYVCTFIDIIFIYLEVVIPVDWLTHFFSKKAHFNNYDKFINNVG